MRGKGADTPHKMTSSGITPAYAGKSDIAMTKINFF